MAWVAIGAWITALVVAVVLLGFCAYEIVWKARRLRGDLRRLHGDADQLTDLQQRLEAAQKRIASTGLR